MEKIIMYFRDLNDCEFFVMFNNYEEADNYTKFMSSENDLFPVNLIPNGIEIFDIQSTWLNSKVAYPIENLKSLII